MAKSRRTYKYRLWPNRKQREVLFSTLEVTIANSHIFGGTMRVPGTELVDICPGFGDGRIAEGMSLGIVLRRTDIYAPVFAGTLLGGAPSRTGRLVRTRRSLIGRDFGRRTLCDN